MRFSQQLELSARLWSQPGLRPCVALDGAGVPGLPQRLRQPAAPRSECLYRGELAPDLAEVAPYLVELPRSGPFLDELLSGWGRHWGVYLLVPEALDFAALRRHLRRLNLVRGAHDEPLLFRWYDPRVLRLLAPLMNAAQLDGLFGPVHRFVLEGDAPGTGLELTRFDGALACSCFGPG